MNKSIKIIIGILSVSVLVIATEGCRKYEDGPMISLRSKTKRLQRAWVLESYLRNDVDETSQLLISNYGETYNEDGSIDRSYTDSDGNPFAERGSWQLENKKEQISVTGIGSIEWTSQTSTVSSSTYNILRLTSKELWYYYDNGGNRHEIHLKAK